MSQEKTPGQLAYEAYEASQGFYDDTWTSFDSHERDGWEAAARAVLATQSIPHTDTVQSLQAFDRANNLRLTVGQAIAVCRWHEASDTRRKEAVGILLGVTGHLPQDDAAIREAIEILKGEP